jgi:hypothetical protein
MIALIVYVLGFICTVAFLNKFGKRIGIDYSAPKDYSNYDDWDSNEQAYTAFGIFWPLVISLLLLAGGWTIAVRLTSWIIKNKKNEPVNRS